MVARQELSLPPTITPEQVKGFALWGARTVLSGRGDELIDLARTNPLRRLL
jgi:pyruvate dehydrogenase (quinone)